MKSLILVLGLVAILSFEGAFAYSGDLTFYYEWRGGYGSCGLERSRYDEFYVSALSRKWMNLLPNPNNHPLCAADKCIQLWGRRGSVVVKISDTCEGCKGDDVDVADSVFPLLDDPNLGRVPVTWEFVNCHTNPPGRR